MSREKNNVIASQLRGVAKDLDNIKETLERAPEAVLDLAKRINVIEKKMTKRKDRDAQAAADGEDVAMD
jgi:hypothetical protein